MEVSMQNWRSTSWCRDKRCRFRLCKLRVVATRPSSAGHEVLGPTCDSFFRLRPFCCLASWTRQPPPNTRSMSAVSGNSANAASLPRICSRISAYSTVNLQLQQASSAATSSNHVCIRLANGRLAMMAIIGMFFQDMPHGAETSRLEASPQTV